MTIRPVSKHVHHRRSGRSRPLVSSDRLAQGRRGFSLVELLIVVAIIALLLGILLPAIGLVRQKARNVAARAQLESISKACSSYEFTFEAYPGYLGAEPFNTNPVYRNITGTESMLLSLIGRVSDDSSDNTWALPGAADKYVHLDSVGSGPETEQGRTMDAFYSPKSGELKEASRTRYDGENEMPELVGPVSGAPVLYYLRHSGGTVPVDTRCPASSGPSGNAIISRIQNVDFTNANDLVVGGESFDNSSSVITSGNGAENDNLAYLVTSPSLSSGGPNSSGAVVAGGFVLFSAGEDGVYFSDDQIDGTTISEYDDITQFDDLRVFGGSP